MERLTEPYGEDYFKVCGNKTLYTRKPQKSSRVAFALAKLFQMEELDVPKKVVMVDGFYGGLACPSCGEIFKSERSLHCPYCGQAIDWKN